MQVGTYPTRNFATLGPSWLQPPFTGAYKKSIKIPSYLTFQHRAGVRPYTSFHNLAESCVFNKQSLPPFFYTLYKALLIPKLRSYFAEFLQYYYLNALVYSTSPPVSVLIRLNKIKFFPEKIYIYIYYY